MMMMMMIPTRKVTMIRLPALVAAAMLLVVTPTGAAWMVQPRPLLPPASSFTKSNVRVTQRQHVIAPSVDATQMMMTTSSSFDHDENVVVVGTLVFLLPHDGRTKPSQRFGQATSSIVEPPTLFEVATHLAQKTNWYTNNRLNYEIVVLDPTIMSATDQSLLHGADILIGLGITTPSERQYVTELFEVRRTSDRPRPCLHWVLEDTNEQQQQQPIPSLVGPYDPQRLALQSKLLPWTLRASGRRLYTQLEELFSRYTSDDFCYGMVVFLHLFSGHQIDWVKYQTDATWEKGPVRNAQEFYRILTRCQDCIVPCIQDPKCRECLSKMAQLDPRDQATSYRTLVSYESEMLTNISRCIFTKQNIFQCHAEIPTFPVVKAMTTFRNQPLTEEVGRALLVGHLAQEETALSGNSQRNVSWMVACGANVAYDQFPNQHQLFYPAAKGRDMWYDPFFRVVTLDGRNIWCQRHYKVRPGRGPPGTFRLSTSDNGVTSDEQWTIVGAADDLSWLVVHYAGAAKTVGLQYVGGLVCTPDGTFQDIQTPQQWNAIWECLRNAGIQPWELSVVDNRNDTPNVVDAGPPPLDYYRGAILKSRQKQITISPAATIATTVR